MDSHFPIGLEQGTDGAIRAQSLSLTGIETIGRTADEAVERFQRELLDALGELEQLGVRVPPRDAEIELTVEEWVESEANVAAGETAICFAADRLPLDDHAIREALDILGALRGRILRPLRRLPDETIEGIESGDTNVRAILDRLAQAHWWTLTRLGASPMAEVPERIIARLDTSMALVVRSLTELPPERRAQLVRLDGEEWTPRRVVRRLLWLEWELGGQAVSALTDSEIVIA